MTTTSAQPLVDAKIKAICDIMRRSNAASALQYIPELTWMLFLRVFDEREESDSINAGIVGEQFEPAIEFPYRWRDWGAPDGEMRQELQSGYSGSVLGFVNEDLIPHLKSLGDQSSSTQRQRVIGEIMSSVEETRIDTERNLLDIFDKVHEIRDSEVDSTHTVTLSQAYEGLLLKMGEKNNDGGQFFTPREVIRAIVRVVDPKYGDTVFDPACGTGGFLALAYEYMRDELGDDATGLQLDGLAGRTFYGKEKENLIYPICLANLILQGVDQPDIWHGNTLTNVGSNSRFYANAPGTFDVILMNPPFGGKEGTDANQRYAYKTGSTQVLFLQEVIDTLAPKGRAGIVVDEGLLVRTSERAFVQTKRKLLDECDLYCIVSLPTGVFTQAGAGVKTNLMFFNKGQTTEATWYYDLSDVKVTKRKPLTLDHFKEFFELLPTRTDSENSWTVKRDEIEARNYDLKAMNPNRQAVVDSRTPEELLDIIETKGEEIRELLAGLRGK